MIVLLSYPGDRIANDVMDWLYHFGCHFKRINLEEEDFRKLSVDIRGTHTEIHFGLKDGSVLNLDEVSVFFFRGGLLGSMIPHYSMNGIPDQTVKTHLSYEFSTLTQFFYREIAKKCLGNPLQHPLNKLVQLQLASEVGLNIPETIIRSSKSGLNSFTEEAVWITKSIQENILVQNMEHVHYDLKVNTIKQSELPEHFFPSLFQHLLSRNIELRVFYLDGKCYTLAMLLHSVPSPVSDYRSVISGIRYGKYKLPADIGQKINRLMKKLNLNIGSIDLIMDTNGTYYFLEVNPTGQIGWVSDYGNYFLEERIARYLLQTELNFLNYGSVPLAG